MTRGLKLSFQKLLFPIWLVCLAFLLAGCESGLPATPAPTKAATRVSSPARSPTRTPQPAVTPTDTPDPVSRVGATPADLQGISVKFWHPWTGDSGQAVQSLVDEFNASNQWGIKVESSAQPSLDDLFGKVNEAAPIGQAPDIVTGYPYQLLEWKAKNWLVDLSTYVHDPLVGFSTQEQEDFYPAFWEQDAWGEQRFGIPAQRSGQLLYYNQTWANELGFATPPLTPSEFERQACTAAQANNSDSSPDNDGSGGYIISTNYSAVLGWITAFNGQVTRPSSSGATADSPQSEGYQFNTPAVANTFNYLRKLYDQHCAWVSENEPPDGDFASRRGLFTAGSISGLPYQAGAFGLAGNGDQWTAIAFPSQSGQAAIDVYGPSYALMASNPQKQLAAWLFIQWLAAPQNSARLVEASSSFPLRASSLPHLENYKNSHPQWAAAVALLPKAHSEPSLQSWNTVRWAVSDATTQLFRYYFTASEVPTLIKLLDQTAAELNGEIKPSPAPTSATPTSKVTAGIPSATPAP